MMLSKGDSMTHNAYGKMRQYYDDMGVDMRLVNQYLPANLYATATRGEIADQRLVMIRALR